jgi:hypothetical protein
VLICLLDRVVVATFAILMSTLHRAKGLDIDRMDRRNCRHQQTAALLSAAVRIGRGFWKMTFFDEGAVVWMPFVACRQTPSSTGLTCPMLHPMLPAMSVRCTMTRPPMPRYCLIRIVVFL